MSCAGYRVGMGTEVQHKMHLPGYYSLRDPNGNPGSNGWPLNYDSKASESGKPYDVFMPRVQKDGISACEKEQLRQTILKHESIFRHQLNELHRLYRIQRNLMNEMKNNELWKHSAPAGTLQTNLISSHVPSQEERKRSYFLNTSLGDSVYGNPSTSRTDGIRTPLSSMNGIYMQSKFGLLQNEVGPSDSPSLESKCKKMQRQFLDLELSADKYINTEQKQDSGASLAESFHTNRNLENTQKYANLATDGSCNSGYNGDASGFNYTGRRVHGFTNSNETNKFEEAFGSASGDNFDYSTSREAGKRGLSAHLYSDFQSKEISHNLPRERNQQLTSIESLSYNTDAGTRSNRISFSESFYTWDPCKSLHSETRIAKEHAVLVRPDEIKAGQSQKRKLFGVEIPERNQSESATPPRQRGLHPFVYQNRTDSKSLSISFSEDLLSNLNQRNNFRTFMPSPGCFDDRFCANGNLRSASVSRTEGCDPCGFNKGLKLECRESQISRPPLIGESKSVSDAAENNPRNCLGALGFSLNEKCSKNINSDTVPLGRDRNEESFQENLVSFGGQRESRRPPGGLSWLQTYSHKDVNSSEEREGSDRTEFSASQNVDRNEKGNNLFDRLLKDNLSAANISNSENKSQLGDLSTDRKILEFPISDETHIAQDLPSSSSSSKPDSVVLSKGSISCNANSKHQIDLNLCAVEEEEASASYSPKTVLKISAEKVEIDLEATVVLENELQTEDTERYPEPKPKEQPQSVQDEYGDSELSRTAAEAIVAISASCLYHRDDNNVCEMSEASQDDCLCWFADIIMSYKDEPQDEVGPVLKDKDDEWHEDTVNEGLDYFEYMTLKLTETKVDECYLCPKPLDNLETEKPTVRRPRRGQARRGRQRKDFQRDILPGLTSLSKYEVTEDLQAFEGIIRATGGTWRSGIVQRNGKSSAGRGRRCSRNSTPSPSKTAAIQSPVQQQTCNDLVLREVSLTGWGKRTRRLPRQRCPLGNSSTLEIIGNGM